MRKPKSLARARIALCAALLLALGITVYPAVSVWNNERTRSQVVVEYTQAVDSGGDQAAEAALAAAQAYNEALAAESAGAGWHPSGATLPSEDVLAGLSHAGALGALRIPAIGVELPIYWGTSDEQLLQGVGVMEGTSLPVGGAGTHSVLAAHSGLRSARYFSDLDQLQVGDTFFVEVLGQVLTYQVDQVLTTLPHDLSAIGIQEGADLVTLVTCTPYGINSHRLLVRGVRVDTPQEAPQQYHKLEQAQSERPSSWWGEYRQSILIGLGTYVGLLIVALPVYFAVQRQRRKKNGGDSP